jgi:hypothetical protein
MAQIFDSLIITSKTIISIKLPEFVHVIKKQRMGWEASREKAEEMAQIFDSLIITSKTIISLKLPEFVHVIKKQRRGWEASREKAEEMAQIFDSLIITSMDINVLKEMLKIIQKKERVGGILGKG